MEINKFEDIIAWQKAKLLTVYIYQIFRNHKDFGFRDQICRASISIMNNIAEGFERYGDKELKRYIYISKASCAEVRSMLYMAFELKYINQQDFDRMYSLSIETSKLLSGFIKKLA